MVSEGLNLHWALLFIGIVALFSQKAPFYISTMGTISLPHGGVGEIS